MHGLKWVGLHWVGDMALFDLPGLYWISSLQLQHAYLQLFYRLI